VRRLAVPTLAGAGLALGVAAYHVQVHDLRLPHERLHALASVAVALSFSFAGLIAWRRRPGNRLGLLMLAAGFALLCRQFRYSHETLLFTVFFAVGDIAYALVGHTILAYPSGRLTTRINRALASAAYGTVAIFPLAVLLFHGATSRLLFFDHGPRRSYLLISDQPQVVEALQKTQVVIFNGVLAGLILVVIVGRLVHATRRARRLLAPLLVAAAALALQAMFQAASAFGSQLFAYDYLFWWQIAAGIALPLAFLAGMLRSRLARVRLGDLVLRLERTPTRDLRHALAEVFRDPSLEVVFWLAERREYVDAAGHATVLPTNDPTRSVTQLGHDGEPMAALVHDPSLLDEPKLLEAAGAAARLALENARLQAETRAQLRKVQESRERLVRAADEERRRIERNLHDGAQQRLVALALQLRSAERRLGEEADPELERIIAETVDELQAAVDELRALARGVHPAILTEEGLAGALESLASRTPFPVSLDVSEERLPPQVEATAYFVVCEALANVLKHANASRATISAQRRDGTLCVAVEDDGVGGARPSDGSGLQGMADRVEALGGRLIIGARAGGGTRVVGEIPCAS
jgi:signal transduction histidine kinase